MKKEDVLIFLKIEDDLKKIMQPKTIKSKNNGCGTAPGNLVLFIILFNSSKERPVCKCHVLEEPKHVNESYMFSEGATYVPMMVECNPNPKTVVVPQEVIPLININT